MKQAALRIALVSLLLAIFAPMIFAQSLTSGDVAGTVTDPSGAVIPNATITLKSVDTGRTLTATTNASGAYRFPLLQPGRYTISVNQAGFGAFEKTIVVALGQATTVPISLRVSSSTQTVEVTAETPVVNTENANISTTFDAREISTVPNPGGDLSYIAQTSPGTVMNTSGGYGNFTNNGLPATSNIFTLNGENNMDPYFNINNTGATNLTLGANEVGEATVVSNPYSGQYGQQAGAQINYITKSGTNNFHGNAQYWWNGRVMNANDWFANNSDTPRPFTNNNQWAVGFGGPIKKDKTFFFANFEGLRYILPTVQNTFIPTPAFQAAIIDYLNSVGRSSSVPVYQTMFGLLNNAAGAERATPMTGSGGCGNLGTGTTAGVAQFAPFGTNGDGAPCFSQFIATPGQLSSEWILSGRVDHNFSNADKVFVRFRSDQGTQATQTDPINPVFNATSNQPSYDGQLQWNHVFGGAATNQFIMAGSWYAAPFVQPNREAAQALFPYGITTTIANFQNFGWAYRYPQGRNITQYQFIDDFTKIFGNHTFKVGANFRRYDVSDLNFGLYNSPRVNFSNVNQLATGKSSYFRQRSPLATWEPIAYWGLGVYGEDEWRVRPNLKLQLALRVERNSNPVCQRDCFSNFKTSFENTNVAPSTPYNQMINTGLTQAYQGVDAVSISPRVGFNWSPGTSGKTVISGGFGIFYDALPASLAENAAILNAPSTVDIRQNSALWAAPITDPASAAAQVGAAFATFRNGFANGLSYADISAAAPAFVAPGYFIMPGTLHTPQFQEWNFQIQQQLDTKTSLTLNYVGNHGIHIPINNYGLNAFDPSGAIADFPAEPLTTAFNTIQQLSTSAVSNYNGLTASLQRKFSRGLSFQANYTWSHAMDEISNGGVNPYDLTLVAGQINPFNLRQNYGNADYDVRHYFSANWAWEAPFKFGNSIMNQVLGGWTFSGTFFARSGLPYTVLDGNVALSNYLAVEPVGQPLFGIGGGQPGQLNCTNAAAFGRTNARACLDPAGFVASFDPAFAGYSTFPTQRRNQYRGPKFFDADFSVQKNFKFGERTNFAVGANMFNVFNHPNFANPDFDLGSISVDPDTGAIIPGTFGYSLATVAPPTSPYGSFVGAAAAPRIIQLTAKIQF